MNFTGTRRVAIKSLKLPGDIKARMKMPHVIELAASIEKLGGEPASMPIIAAGTREVIAGRDRIAACMINKTPRLWVRVAEGEPEEFKALEVDENLRRRQDSRKELLAEAVKLEKAAIEAKAKESGTVVPAKKIEKEAREKTAKKAGVKPESVRKAVQRQKAKEAPPKSEKPPIAMMGLELSKATLTAISRIKASCEELERYSKACQSEVSSVAGIMPGAVVARLMEKAKELGAEARAVKPEHICPVCDGEGDDKCKLCRGAHYARAEQMADIPKEQLERRPKTNGVTTEA